MNTLQTTKIIKASLLAGAFALSLACGYSSKQTPPVAGTMPAISQLSPDSADAGSGALTLTVNGSNFGGKAVVNWNGTAQVTTYVSGNQLTVAVPASLLMTAGTASITVTNPATPGTGTYGTGATLAETSQAVDFTIN